MLLVACWSRAEELYVGLCVCMHTHTHTQTPQTMGNGRARLNNVLLSLHTLAHAFTLWLRLADSSLISIARGFGFVTHQSEFNCLFSVLLLLRLPGVA